MTIKVLSSGGGLDSFAMLLDAIDRGEIPDYMVFADVGSGSQRSFSDDGEWPGTYRHLREIAFPLAESHGIKTVWLTSDEYPIRKGPSLLAYHEKKHLLPTRQSRMCTSAAKVERIADWIKDNLQEKAEVWIGFGAGEEHRIAKDPHATKVCGDVGSRVNRFPLVERGLCRCREELLVRRHNLPVPRKSACFFCPMSTRGDLIKLSRELPEQFDRVVQLERNSKLTEERRIKLMYQERPLDEDVLYPYHKPAIICPGCGRRPRATKAVGVDYLPPEEYVRGAESPELAARERAKIAARIRRDEERRAAKRKKKARRNPADLVEIRLAPDEIPAATWLAARFAPLEQLAEIVDGSKLLISLEEAEQAAFLLSDYLEMAGDDCDTDLDEAVYAERLARKIGEAL